MSNGSYEMVNDNRIQKRLKGRFCQLRISELQFWFPAPLNLQIDTKKKRPAAIKLPGVYN